MSALEEQVGGNHYKHLVIQPAEYSYYNGLDALQHTVVRYITRFREKNGREDLEKIKHVVDLLIELEYETGGEQLMKRIAAFIAETDGE